ncbi:hypothetical protein KAFR_0C01390 [Kazachstania africana CBS 2517]|uniref:DNA 3'-5' helicase n=1 Tax=Kazachstania africana (strain ATCC 22294 / BCRC 22015 / CBS 2517 / CECT 1963 / NBRC 1671 / NRRL Y-8276) TaxID=1071382 RepID=H2ARY2_KAZAF|nr:hypothetical protein KAFR_0C01390 [Kazachstania africana CBS 2517]CCF57132.1 hypothetical protein KAFR_0C01390 [Kazachstania africana CBS 2517]
MSLTQAQGRVLHHPFKENTTLKVLAGPGSGKTFTLLHKIHHLIETEQIKPDEILVLSLTNKAVDKIVDELFTTFQELNKDSKYSFEELKEIVEQVGVYTIHGLANRVVVEREGLVNIIEENGWRGLLKLISEDFWKSKNINVASPRRLQKLLQSYKQNDDNDEVIEKIVKIMNDCKVLTNDDLISRATNHLNEKIEINDGSTVEDSYENFTLAIQKRYKVVLIDEFQDLYPALLPIIKKIAKGKQLILFGDTNQSIYEFLGHNKYVVESLDKLNLPHNNHVLYLGDNFRCTPEIISAATKILPLNHDTSHTDFVLKEKSGIIPQVYQIKDPLEQLEFLVKEICELASSSAKFSDIAILSRTNSHLQTIADHLTLYGIPFEKLASQPDWLNDVRIQFIIDLLKVLTMAYKEAPVMNPDNISTWKSDFSVIVTLSTLKGIGTKSIQTLYSASTKKGISLWKYITEIPTNQWPSSIPFRGKIENYAKVLYKYLEAGEVWSLDAPIALIEYVSGIASQLDYAPFQFKSIKEMTEFKIHLEEMFKIMKLCTFNKPTDLSLVEWFLETYFDQSSLYHHAKLACESEGAGVVKLSTIHSSKGLEFPITFLMSPALQKFPMDDNTLYVGMTRARNLLYMININHSRIQQPFTLNKNRAHLLSNKSFWNYYNNDLNRGDSFKYSLETNLYNYGRLQNKFGFSRSYSTLCGPIVRICSKYLPR